jgi:hypothetical protein
MKDGKTRIGLRGAYLKAWAKRLWDEGETISEIAEMFGTSYEWTRRSVKDVRYVYEVV